jgi:hypothetical protein
MKTSFGLWCERGYRNESGGSDKEGANYNPADYLEGVVGLFVVALASCQWNPEIPGCRPVLWPNPLLLISAVPMLVSTQAMAKMAMPRKNVRLRLMAKVKLWRSNESDSQQRAVADAR